MAGPIYFFATEQQARELAANAISASIPLGENIFCLELPRAGISWRDISVRPSGNIHIEFFQNLQVHLTFERVGEMIWRIPDAGQPSLSRQSWARKFPSWEDLISTIECVRIIG